MEDEVLSGYVGRFILQNGIDLYSNPWPIWFFDKFGDYYIIGPMYLAGASTFLFGITALAVRFPTALLGSLIIFPMYHFTKYMFGNKQVALLSALFVGISPWHIILSRSTVEGVIGSTLFLCSIVLILSYLINQTSRHLIIALVLLFSTYFIYHPFRMYVPLVLIPLPFLFPQVRKYKNILMSIGIAFIFFASLTFYISTTPWGSGRFMQTSIFSELSGVSIRTQEQIFNVGQNDVLRARIFHNKVVGYGREFIRQYVTYFSPNFLFTSGGAESRYDVPDQGLLYLTYLVLIIIAISPLKAKTIKINTSAIWYYFYLLLLAPLPAAITYYGSPNIHRSVFLGILLVIPAAYGMYKVWFVPYRKIVIGFFIVILLAESIYFWHQYSVQSDKFTSMRRNDAHVELMDYIQDHQNEYDRIYVPAEGATSLYYLFVTHNFDKSLAEQFQKDAYIKSIDNVFFVEASCPTEKVLDAPTNSLIVNRHNCPEKPDLNMNATIKGKNELLGFTIYESK
jgi:4-amino-4-deoxy-L-arabinose transferase-like glycosyltransferase